MKKSTGYKEMLRDRMPRTISLALKWCKAKEKWLNLVYSTHIRTVPKNMRGTVVKQCLGIKQKWSTSDMHAYLPLKGISHQRIDDFIESTQPSALKRLLSMDFNDTIPWENLTQDETEYWNRVSSWVRWFRSQYAYIQNTYEISKKIGRNVEDIKIEIIQKFLSSLLPKNTDDEETKNAKYAYVNSLVDYLVDSIEES